MEMMPRTTTRTFATRFFWGKRCPILNTYANYFGIQASKVEFTSCGIWELLGKILWGQFIHRFSQNLSCIEYKHRFSQNILGLRGSCFYTDNFSLFRSCNPSLNIILLGIIPIGDKSRMTLAFQNHGSKVASRHRSSLHPSQSTPRPRP